MNKLLRRYLFFIILLLIQITFLVIEPTIGQKSLSITWKNTLEMLSVVPPIFILLGLMDVWVEKETMIKLMGDNSGFRGIIIAFFLGSMAAGPLYAAFPVAGILLKKGSKLSNVLIFIGAWSTTKIPLLLFEASSLGWNFMLIRFLLNIPGIAIIAYLSERILSEKEKKDVYERNSIATQGV
ncbi:Predicted permease [Desulfonispora thiosulfatigenes DSM 11270]|uniref:Predicted permease n=1 Tax=Desulfonispora thiosulfatigenes DSM 11270 TaxID=656914 RepID=A0A1W1UEH2_DESTI|nr:permease [Desulfonispora thiosulfatigenes]SMB79201.1 Predicted permease [Desulfonispora thiosulfatigenes DSM 11270]